MHPELSFEQAPPLSVPYRFFLTAPWFGVAAGLLLAFEGNSALVTRWSPVTLALTHLLTAGFMLQAMCGALLQFVPVAAGGNVRHPRRVAWLVHPSLGLACVCLVGAFLTGRAVLYQVAILLAGAGGAVFIYALVSALRRLTVISPTLRALRLALAGLGLTLLLGMALAWSLGGGPVLPLLELTAVHVAFGFGAWSLVLLIGVSLYVVPMFQLTPPYPAMAAARLPLLVWAGALLVAVPLALPWPRATDLGVLLLSGAAAAYAVVTLRLQIRRRRRITDPAFWCFRGGMVAILLAASAAVLRPLLSIEYDMRLQLTTGVFVTGAFVSVINGMLYKIVPFINWLHLQRETLERLGPGTLPPNMKVMIPDRMAHRQMLLHFLALAAVAGACWWPPLARPAGFLWAASAAWLGLNLVAGVRRYLEFRDRIRAAASPRGS